MSYLTKFELNRARRETAALVSSPQRMHAAVMAAFTSAEHAAEGRPLWRIDRGMSAWHLYIVSPARPDLTHLVEQAGWPTKPEWLTREYGPLLSRLTAGQRWAFRLRANPSYVKSDASGAKKLRSHNTPRNQLRWLFERASRIGIEFPSATWGEPDVVVGSAGGVRFAHGDTGPVRIFGATYDGSLEVVDADALRLALVSGVGRSKAYGCGLLTLAPV